MDVESGELTVREDVVVAHIAFTDQGQIWHTRVNHRCCLSCKISG